MTEPYTILPFGEALRARMAFYTRSARELAEAIDRDKTTVWRWTNRETAPSDFDGLMEAARFLNAPFEDLRAGLVPLSMLTVEHLTRVTPIYPSNPLNMKEAIREIMTTRPPGTSTPAPATSESGSRKSKPLDPRIWEMNIHLLRGADLDPDALDDLLPFVEAWRMRLERDHAAMVHEEHMRNKAAGAPPEADPARDDEQDK